MSDPLDVDPEGLRVASAILSAHADDVAHSGVAVGNNGAPSSVGAASFAASIENFRAAYARRLRERAGSVAVAATSYTESDARGAADIATVRI
jgi:hypothetical protein